MKNLKIVGKYTDSVIKGRKQDHEIKIKYTGQIYSEETQYDNAHPQKVQIVASRLKTILLRWFKTQKCILKICGVEQYYICGVEQNKQYLLGGFTLQCMLLIKLTPLNLVYKS